MASALISEPDLIRELLTSELVYTPTEPIPAGERMEAEVANLVQALEEHEDTLRVYTTLDTGVDGYHKL